MSLPSKIVSGNTTTEFQRRDDGTLEEFSLTYTAADLQKIIPAFNSLITDLGSELAARNHVYYVDGSRTDTYTEDGSIFRPYKDPADALDAINTISATLLSTAADFELCKFIVNIAPGKYTSNITISTARYIRINMEGAELAGDITITQNQLGLSDYYGKVEFYGGAGNRADKGKCGLISGDITFLKEAYDSLAYDVLCGINVTGNISYGTAEADTHGTWVLCLINSNISNSSKYISAYLAAESEHVLIESFGHNEIKADIAKQDDSATKVTLYNCNNTKFYVVNTTPLEDCLFKNCEFAGTTSIVAAKNLKIDANSSMSLFGQTETLTGMTIVALDGILKTTATVATRAAARALVGDGVAIGTILVSGAAVATTKPNVYIKVLNTPGDTDWERIVTQASD